MMLATFLLVAVATQIHGFDDTSLDGIAYVQETVQDLALSIRFYTEVLDGMLIPEFRVRALQSDADYYKMFQKEILDAREQGVPPEDVGVPDIRTGGTHVVNWDFILFDNSLVWLVQFTEVAGNLFERFDFNVGSAKSGFGHMAMWASSSVNRYQMIQAIYDGQRDIGSPTTGFTTGTDQTSFAGRNAAIDNDITETVPGEFGGFSFVNTRGPNGEKIEFSLRRGIGAIENFVDFCSVGTVHSAMLPDSAQKVTNQYTQSRVKTNGFHHVSYTIPNTADGVDFYTNVIGGKNANTDLNIQYPTGFRNLIVQDDFLSAVESNREADATFGFVDVLAGDPNSGTMEMTFINFENFFLELYAFNPVNPDDKPLLERPWSSIAYSNTVTAGFWVKESVALPDYIKAVEAEATERGYTSALANRAVDVDTLGQEVPDIDYSRPIASGDLQGFDYVFAKGPGGEAISYAKFSGSSGQILEKMYKIYGGVSVAYPETNPYTWGGFDSSCNF